MYIIINALVGDVQREKYPGTRHAIYSLMAWTLFFVFGEFIRISKNCGRYVVNYCAEATVISGT